MRARPTLSHCVPFLFGLLVLSWSALHFPQHASAAVSYTVLTTGYAPGCGASQATAAGIWPHYTEGGINTVSADWNVFPKGTRLTIDGLY